MSTRTLGTWFAGLLALMPACARDVAPGPIILFADGASVAPSAKIESSDFAAVPLRFYKFECRVRSPSAAFVAAVWRNPDATWGRDLQGRPGDLRAEDYQSVAGSDDWQTIVFYSRAQANAVAGCLRVQALDEPMEVASASVSGPIAAIEVLQWSEALSSGVKMPPLVGAGALPRTAAAFRDGGALRIVFLGDSIMQDAANSPVDLWLEREHPGLRVEITTAIGGGAGMQRWNNPDKFPGHDLNLQAAVIDQRPDLVLIGGISNGGAYDDVRAVIARIQDGAREISAAVPDIALMTGPFGEWRGVDHTNDADAEALHTIAVDSGVAFMDLRRAWIEAVAGSGRAPESFYRDAIHGNAAGKHLQGALLSAWLSAAKPLK